ncbi:MAG: DUF1588 domain-containing protein [Verrucomicrobiaceae bacterium]|nr:DUF1588 domain-containing protein [Verrucomicrobiaceae bacterium]
MSRLLLIVITFATNVYAASPSSGLKQIAHQHLETYCFDCHDEEVKKGNLDLIGLLDSGEFDGSLMFENLITGKMPPAEKKQPSTGERQSLLRWLAQREVESLPNSFRRISRHEFVHSINDLLNTNFDLTKQIPEDRGTFTFDSDRRIQMTKQQLAAYFAVADDLLEFAFPASGFHPETTWVTNSVRDSHETYRDYARKHKDGILFSWTRSNNGRPYPFFYDHFNPPVEGWYDLTFDAAKRGDFPEDISIMVFAGKYFYADDRPQPQRVLDVLSLGSDELKPHTVRVYLKPGENVSVHCYSKHTWRQSEGEQGAYIEKLTVKGPVFESWPPQSYQTVFAGLPLDVPDRSVQLGTADGGTFDHIAVKAQFQAMRSVIKRFAERAFSSSLIEDDLEPYYQVSLRHLEEHRDFVAATKVGLKAIISSHRFLLVPGEHANDSFKIAADLARSVWLSVPDSQLLERAARDDLKPAALHAEITRLLADAKSERLIHSLCAQWLNLRSFNNVAPSLKLYPNYNELLNHYLPIETESYLAHLIEHNLPVSHLIDSDFSFLNQRLAQHYGVDGVIGQAMRRVSLPPGSSRGGLMTMGSVLKVTTDGFDTSPILRGAWVSRNIAGNTLSPPPENVEVIEPDLSDATTLKEQVAKHKKSKICYSCHKSIDPYGFALESFDATGQWRTLYRVKMEHRATFQYRPQGFFRLGGKIDASGDLDGAKFESIVDLKDLLLVDSTKVAYNFARVLFEYATGLAPNLEHRMELYDLIPMDAEECRMRDLLIDVLTYSFSQKED